MRLELDEEALELLAEQGLEPDSVPASGQCIRLRRKSNISTGGTHRLVPVESVHPDNCQLSIRAAQVLGLHIAGIDLIMEDAAQSWRDVGGVVCEVNAHPQIGFRDTPMIYGEILSDLLQDGGTIPLYLLVVQEEQGPGGVEDYVELADKLDCNGISTPQGVWIEGAQRVWEPKHSYAAARAMLIDRDLQAGLVVMTIGNVLRFGLPAAWFTSIQIPVPEADSAALASEMNAIRELVQSHSDQIL
jgi:cyanophycin synthetase